MPHTYKNRRGDAYYFYAKTTKTGKTTYTAAKKLKPGALDELPEGFEIYETYESRVFLRRTDKQNITDLEVQQVRQVMHDVSPLKYIWVERNTDAIIISIYPRETDPDSFAYSGATAESDASFGFLGDINRQAMGDYFSQHATLIPMMRFVLCDEDERLYTAERYCSRGTIDDWIGIYSGEPSPLDDLAREYCPHLGKDSFYELM